MSDQFPPFTPQPAEPTEPTQPPTSIDLLTLPELWQSVLRSMMRQPDMSVSELAQQLQQSEASLQALLDTLQARGFVQATVINSEPRYRTHLTTRPGRKVPDHIWHRLEDHPQNETQP